VETLAERFSLLKVPFLVIERSESVAKSIYKNYLVPWGDPSSAEVLRRASISSARLFIANEKDELNAEVILILRDISDIEIIALVDDLTRSRFLRYAEASRIISPKILLGTFIAQITSLPMRNVFPGSIQLFGDLLLVELPIYPGAELIGEKLEEIGTKNTAPASWASGREASFIPAPARGNRAL
jgi:voltage-gated potassium channel